VGRSWFGQRAGIAAAALVALSRFSVALNAAALTDALLGLWLLLAVDALGRSLANDGSRSVTTTDFRWAVIAGIYTGLAWWTKYNGWLPLAIGAAALPLVGCLLRPPTRQWLAWSASFAATALVAAIIWSPHFFWLQSQGGYGPIAANHAQYVVGLAGWFESAQRQAANFLVLDAGWTGAAIVVALVLARVTPTSTIAEHESRRPRRKIGLALVSVWWLGLFAATPCYWPYPRLLLPLLLATWLGVALLIDRLYFYQPVRVVCGSVLAVALAALLMGGGWWWAARIGAMGNDRQAVLKIADQLRNQLEIAAPVPDRIPPAPARAVYLFGEPALFFQLAAAGEPIVIPVQDLPAQSAAVEGAPLPTFLVAGPHAARDPRFREQLAAASGKWRLVQSYPYQPSPLVWLDLHDPRTPPAGPDAADDAFRLFEFLP
jgi:dolichyl-phosphate-mannose-protein mannosyltransferase